MNNKKNSVLVVDDENSNVLALTHILGSDYTIYAAKNGQNALETAERYLPDVILLDIVMPEMDGYAVIAALKESDKTQHIPVIFVTGLDNAGDEEKGLSLGAADYITKPFRPSIVKLRVWNQIRIINQTQLIIEKELAEKSSRTRIDLLSRVSHEMLTPMNTIMGITHLLTTAGASGKTKEYLNEIGTASRHLLKLINNLLDTSGVKDGVLTLIDSAFSFNLMLQDVLSGIDRDVVRKQQRFTFDIDPAIPAKLIGDKERLARIIANLLANAVKFTPRQGEVHFSVGVLEDNGDTVVLKIEVSDNGIGISKPLQENIFNMFNPIDDGATREYRGIGLGLPLSKRIVEMMEGQIWVVSEPGKGSQFTFTCKMRKG